jgi:hypothetical protein
VEVLGELNPHKLFVEEIGKRKERIVAAYDVEGLHNGSWNREIIDFL